MHDSNISLEYHISIHLKSNCTLVLVKQTAKDISQMTWTVWMVAFVFVYLNHSEIIQEEIHPGDFLINDKEP